MPGFTTSYTKNIIRRSLRELVDPSPKPKDVTRIWSFFESCCAYCGQRQDKSRKEGHIDHLVSAAKGGANGLSNRILSCATCNEKEKLDSDWRQFLEAKVEDVDVRNERIERIEAWIECNSRHSLQLSHVQLQLVDAAAQRVIDCYDAEVNHVRAKPVQVRHKAILITINILYRSDMTAEELYEATRGIWRVGDRRERAEYGMAVYQGIVREVYRIEKWHPSGTLKYRTRDPRDFKTRGRWEFEGNVAADIRNEYVGNSVGMGGQNPIRYMNI